MTPSDLRYHVEQAGTSPYFFDRKTMRGFGDTMRNYGVRAATVRTYCGDVVDVWELYRRRPVKGGNQGSAYFCAKTYRRVQAIVEVMS